MLVVIGVYSLIAYTVSRQTREIGIRIAIGAEPRRRASNDGRDGPALARPRHAIGLAASFAATRVLASQLYEVSPSDPLTFALVVAIIAAGGIGRELLPALRATRVGSDRGTSDTNDAFIASSIYSGIDR